MQDIADRLNISKNSVSQAISKKAGVSEETRKKVEKTAQEMGYNYKLNKGKTKNVGQGNIILISSERSITQEGFFGKLYLAIQRAVAEHGFNLLIQSIDEKAKENLILPTPLKNSSIEGILILSHISTDYINRLIDTGIPTVIIDHHNPFNQVDSVLQNNRFAAYTAIHHLIELGHKQIGFIGHIDRSPSYQERFEGYNLALTDHNLLDKRYILSDIQEDEYSVATALDQLQEQPTAWFCVNDGFAFFALSHLQSMDYVLPDDLSICSCDNGILSKLSKPKMTTIHVDLDLYGKKAVDQLLWRMNNPFEPVQEILLPASLIERDSTGPAPSK